MVGDLFMGDLQLQGIFNPAFFQQKIGQTFIKAFEHDLFHEPHQFRIITGQQIPGVVGNGKRLLCQILKQTGRNAPKFTVFFCFDHDIQLHIRHHTGSTEQTGVIVKKSPHGDLPTVGRQNIGSELSGTDHHQPQTIGTAVMNMMTSQNLPLLNDLRNSLLLFFGQLVPKGNVIGKFHMTHLLETV